LCVDVLEHSVSLHHLWRWNRCSVLKHWHMKYRCRESPKN